jgi:hypothetical protein
LAHSEYGDIPALPTPLLFGLGEPVDLIIATIGSILFGVGYHRWVLATKDETILLRGGGLDDGIHLLMTSYRSELGGLVTGLAVLGDNHIYKINNGQYLP